MSTPDLEAKPLLPGVEEDGKNDREQLDKPRGNDLAVLETVGGSLESDRAYTVSFQGIRRKLGLHQETLSRSLHRLEKEGLIERIRRDYRILPKGENLITGLSEIREHEPKEEAYPIPILRSILPSGNSAEQVERILSRKWFGNLRWYGSSRSEDSLVLSWITEDGKMKLLARISEGFIAIESEATTKETMSEAVNAAYEIFEHVSQGLKAVPRFSQYEKNTGRLGALSRAA